MFNILVSLFNKAMGPSFLSDDKAIPGCSKSWIPTERDVAALVVYTLSGLCGGSVISKGFVLNCPAARASTHIGYGNGSSKDASAMVTPPRPPSTFASSGTAQSNGDMGSVCYRLLSGALSSRNPTSYRMFCVSLLESFMRGVDGKISSAASRMVVSSSVIKALRDSLSASSPSSSESLPDVVFAALIDALASALLPPGNLLNRSTHPDQFVGASPSSVTNKFASPINGTRQHFSSKKATSCTAALEPVVSIPELVAWVADRYFYESEQVMCSLLRPMARLGDENSYSNVASSRKLHANVLSNKVLLVIWNCISASESVQVRSFAVLAMWTILQSSESARAILRDLRTSHDISLIDTISQTKVSGEPSLRALDVLCEMWR